MNVKFFLQKYYFSNIRENCMKFLKKNLSIYQLENTIDIIRDW